MKRIRGTIFCLLAAIFWGVAFVAQDVAGDVIQPFTFTAARYTLGGVVLVLIAIAKDLITKPYRKKRASEEKKALAKTMLIGGVACGVVLCAATNLQQLGLSDTTAGKSGFITSCYIILVPIIGLFFKKKCPIFVWFSVALAVVGLYFLCMSEGFGSFGKGEAVTMGCSLCFAVHILTIDFFIDKVDGIKLSCLQAFTCAAISWIIALIFEKPDVGALLRDALIPLLYTGIMSAGVAYTFQILGQKDLPPTVASLVMSVESVVSVVAAWIILQQKLTVKEIVGCAIIFVAVILAQIPMKKKTRPQTSGE